MIYKEEPVGGYNFNPDERTGYLEINAFPSQNPPSSGTKAFFNKVEEGERYLSIKLKKGRLNDSKMKVITSGSLLNDIKNLKNNSKHTFSIGLKARDESLSGLLTEISLTYLLIKQKPNPIPPTIPTLISPEDGYDASGSLFITLKWKDSKGAKPINYKVQIDRHITDCMQCDPGGIGDWPPSFSSDTVTTSNNVLTIDNFGGHLFGYIEWRVKATNKYGSSEWSNFRKINCYYSPPVFGS